MARLQQKPVQFFTALGRDSLGEACVKRLKHLGLEVHDAWRELPTRRDLSGTIPSRPLWHYKRFGIPIAPLETESACGIWNLDLHDV